MVYEHKKGIPSYEGDLTEQDQFEELIKAVGVSVVSLNENGWENSKTENQNGNIGVFYLGHSDDEKSKKFNLTRNEVNENGRYSVSTNLLISNNVKDGTAKIIDAYESRIVTYDTASGTVTIQSTIDRYSIITYVIIIESKEGQIVVEKDDRFGNRYCIETRGIAPIARRELSQYDNELSLFVEASDNKFLNSFDINPGSILEKSIEIPVDQTNSWKLL